MHQKFATFILSTEKLPIGFGLWMATALSIIFIRNSLESLIDYGKFPDITAFDLVHVPVLFLSVLLGVILILHFFSATGVAALSRTCLIGFLVILVPILVDLIPALRGTPTNYNYVFENPGVKFLNFFNPFYSAPDIPISQRLEVAIITILSFIYIVVKTGRLVRAVLGALCIFLLIFAYGALPAFIINAFNGLVYPVLKLFLKGPVGATMDESVIVITQLFSLTGLCAMWYWRYDSHKFRAIVGNLRWERSVHYVLMALLGLRLAVPAVSFQDLFILFKIGAMLTAIFFAFQHAVVVNDLFDVAGDKMTNTRRPLVSAAMERQEYFLIGSIFLALALAFALWVSDACFMVIVFLVALAFIYSAPPLRLKKNLFSSMLILGLEAMLVFVLGQVAFSPPGSVLTINATVALLIFIIICLGESIKDLKDIEGDAATGVVTLPVLLGEKDARNLIGGLVALGYVLTAVFLVPHYAHLALTWFAFLFAGLNFCYIARSGANERGVFLLYFAYGLILFALLK